MKKILLATLLASATSLSGAAELTLTVDNIRNAKGSVTAVLFSNAGSFNSFDIKDAEGVVSQKAQSGEMTFSFHNLTPGDYAVSLLHDEDNDGDMDMSKGIPEEGYAYSNNVGKNDEPKFKDASFSISTKPTSQQIDMIYHNTQRKESIR